MVVRGGGVGGVVEKDLAANGTGAGSSKRAGHVNAKVSEVSGNSRVLSWGVDSLFFSDFFPAAMALQREQGCWPSKVRVTAWEMESWRKLSASMEVQATD